MNISYITFLIFSLSTRSDFEALAFQRFQKTINVFSSSLIFKTIRKIQPLKKKTELEIRLCFRFIPIYIAHPHEGCLDVFFLASSNMNIKYLQTQATFARVQD